MEEENFKCLLVVRFNGQSEEALPGCKKGIQFNRVYRFAKDKKFSTSLLDGTTTRYI